MSVQTEVPKMKADLTATALQGVVKATDPDGDAWKEVADVLSFSTGGAAFYLPRDCKVGTLVSLMLPLPAHLRCYDHDKEFYRVWGLVQHCQFMGSEEDGAYHVGVAFIGKRPPESHREDPTRSYRICGMNDDGLWNVESAKSEFRPRRHLRYWTNVEIYLAILNNKRDAIGGEWTKTENISKSGAAVFSELDIEVGQRVKLISERHDFSGLAVVCNRQTGKDHRTRLHLQFVDSAFPVDMLDQSSISQR